MKSRLIQDCILIASLYQTTAFTFRSLRRSRPGTFLPAIIYGWDDDSNSIDQTSTQINNPLGFNDCDAHGMAVAESITLHPDKVGSIARLAVAFSDQALSLKEIEHVSIVCVKPTHMDLEAILCENLGCVSLAVPISFPQRCGEDVLESCVLDYVEALDEETISRLLSKEEDQGFGPPELHAVVAFPPWWVSPDQNTELVKECTFIRRLLNEDEFADDIKTVCQQQLSIISQGAMGAPVSRAVVSAVGPAGLLCRAQAGSSVVDVLIPFGGHLKPDPTALRAAVLGLVAAAM